MSLSKHDSPFANSGLVVTIPAEAFGGGDVLAGVRLQQAYERRAFEVGRRDYLCPILLLSDQNTTLAVKLAKAYVDPRGNPLQAITMAGIVLYVRPLVALF